MNQDYERRLVQQQMEVCNNLGSPIKSKDAVDSVSKVRVGDKSECVHSCDLARQVIRKVN